MVQFQRGSRRKVLLALPGMVLALVLGIGLGLRAAAAPAEPALLITFSVPSGYYDHDVEVALQADHPQAVIYFTRDGRLPNAGSGTRYQHPLKLAVSDPAVVVLRARAVLPDGRSGPMFSASYAMGLPSRLPILSLIVDPADLWSPDQGIYTNHERRGRAWERPVAMVYVDSDREAGFQTNGGIRIHGGRTRAFGDKKSFRLYFRATYGLPRLAYPLFDGDVSSPQGQTEFDRLVLHNSGQDLLLFKNQLVDRLAWQLGGNATRSQPVLLFLNGRPWGIYQLRERIDDRFLAETYGITAADLTDTPNNRGMQSEEQLAVDTVHWEQLMGFVADHNLSVPENYAYLQSQIDIADFVDYYLLQMYVANTDWPHHNVHQFRPRTQGGRWQWIVWDNDYAFGLPQHQMVQHILDIQHPLGERMTVFMNKLLQNDEFHALFVRRAADLFNTTLAPEAVTAEIDWHADRLASDIHYEIERWSVPYEWETAVQSLRDFALIRTDLMREHFVQSLALPGTARLGFRQEGAPHGWLVVNDTAPTPFPWQGVYFQDTELQVRAIPGPGFGFVGWEVASQPLAGAGPVLSLPVTADAEIVARFAPLAPGVPAPGDVEIVQFQPDGGDHSRLGRIEGDWFELMVRREDGLDLRGWRATDNDSQTDNDEGSLVLADDPLLAHVPAGVSVVIVAEERTGNNIRFWRDGFLGDTLVLYMGNGRLDGASDPWFDLVAGDNLALLAPGTTAAFADDWPVDLLSLNDAVSPATFGLPPE